MPASAIKILGAGFLAIGLGLMLLGTGERRWLRPTKSFRTSRGSPR
jgi:hypothetical protein